MFRIEGDRREHPRVSMERPCKVYDPRGERYLAGETRDISTHGLLIDIPRITHLKPGDTLHIGVATKRRQGLLHAREMIEAKVVRSLATIDDHTAVAVQFNAPADVVEIEADHFRTAA